MSFSQFHRIGFAAGVGMLVVIPLLTFSTQKPVETHVAAVEASETPPLVEPEIPPAPAAVFPPELVAYIEVLDGCASGYEGACVNVRSGPGTEYPVVTTLRTGVVLRVEKTIYGAERDWYKITFDEWVRYPNRVAKNWYVAADIVHLFYSEEPIELAEDAPRETVKRIVVDRSEQMLYAYEGDTLFMEQHISTGHDATPTPRGTFTIFRKTPSRYMQGPVPGITEPDDVYDLPGVPWTMYFTKQGGALHGAYWHDEFGNQHSHGCVNLPPEKARELYEWAPLGTPVTVRD